MKEVKGEINERYCFYPCPWLKQMELLKFCPGLVLIMLDVDVGPELRVADGIFCFRHQLSHISK